jgi:hypothetical protein
MVVAILKMTAAWTEAPTAVHPEALIAAPIVGHHEIPTAAHHVLVRIEARVQTAPAPTAKARSLHCPRFPQCRQSRSNRRRLHKLNIIYTCEQTLSAA